MFILCTLYSDMRVNSHFYFKLIRCTLINHCVLICCLFKFETFTHISNTKHTHIWYINTFSLHFFPNITFKHQLHLCIFYPSFFIYSQKPHKQVRQAKCKVETLFQSYMKKKVSPIREKDSRACKFFTILELVSFKSQFQMLHVLQCLLKI